MRPAVPRVTAADAGEVVSIYAEQVTASTTTRTITGTVVRFGSLGRTSAGRLRVRPGALRFPEDVTRVKLTREHNRDESRGHMTALDVSGERIRASFRVSDGELGDAALREANDRTRDGLSFDVVDAEIVAGWIEDAQVIAVGQVGIPAYDDGRVESVAASHSSRTTQGEAMTPAQRARLAELRALTTRTAEQETELSMLATLEAANPEPAPDPAPQPATDPARAPPAPASDPAPAAPAASESGTPVAASVPAVPGGVPTPNRAPTQVAGNALNQMIRDVTAALRRRDGSQLHAVTAALSDITHTEHTGTIEQPAWVGELWSGLQYEPEFSPLLSAGTLTHWEGTGWRFTSKLEIKDYLGDKAEIPTADVTTEPDSYEAARMAVGVDVDRKFFDFPNEAFVESLFQQVRESWAIKLDVKARTWLTTNAVAVAGLAAQPTLLKAAARAVLALKRRRVGRATFVVVNDEDFFTLFDYAEKDVPVFLELYGIDPKNFVSSPDVAEGTVLAGVRQTASLLTLPGSPIRVEAQNLTHGGIDEAFFGYWAVQRHHKQGIASTTFTAPVEEPAP